MFFIKLIFYINLSIVIICFLYLLKKSMENKNTENSNFIPPTFSIIDFQTQEMRIVFVLLKHLVDAHPNDADLGREMRILFDNINFQ